MHPPRAAAPQAEITTLLEALRAGDGQARDQLIDRVYEGLHRMAEGLLRRERPDPALQPTAVLHEAFVQLFRADVLLQAPNRAFLFGAAARAMRQVLADHARRRAAGKRGGGWQRVPLDDVLDSFEQQNLDVAALHEALERLAALDERQSQVVTLRFFGGFSVAEVAGQLGVSVGTVERDFRLARAWLRQQLEGNSP